MASKESSYGKTFRNLTTEDRARLVVLEADPRMQQVDLPTKKAILKHLGLEDRFTSRTFDLVRTRDPSDQIDVTSVGHHLDEIELIELKGTENKNGNVRDESLRGFFFGATENEFKLAEELGDRYRFAFVVLNFENDLGRPFHVLLTLDELNQRIRTKRKQYQINL